LAIGFSLFFYYMASRFLALGQAIKTQEPECVHTSFEYQLSVIVATWTGFFISITLSEKLVPIAYGQYISKVDFPEGSPERRSRQKKLSGHIIRLGWFIFSSFLYIWQCRDENFLPW